MWLFISSLIPPYQIGYTGTDELSMASKLQT